MLKREKLFLCTLPFQEEAQHVQYNKKNNTIWNASWEGLRVSAEWLKRATRWSNARNARAIEQKPGSRSERALSAPLLVCRVHTQRYGRRFYFHTVFPSFFSPSSSEGGSLFFVQRCSANWHPHSTLVRSCEYFFLLFSKESKRSRKIRINEFFVLRCSSPLRI